MNIRESFQAKLNELREPKDDKKRRKETLKVSTEREGDKWMDKLYPAATDARKKAIKSKDKKDVDAANKATDDLHRSGKRWRKLDKASEKVDEDVSSLLAGTLAAVPVAVAGMKSGIIPKAVDKTSAMLKKIKKKITKKKLEEASIRRMKRELSAAGERGAQAFDGFGDDDAGKLHTANMRRIEKKYGKRGADAVERRIDRKLYGKRVPKEK